MQTIVLKSEQIKLPKGIAKKFKGRKLEVLETREGVLLKPVENSIKAARGFLKKCKFSTERYLQYKQEEKQLER